jgi:hypothetical protein
LKEESTNPKVFHRVLVVSIVIMKENELCEESKETKEEEDTGVSAEMAKEVSDAKKSPPEEGV